MPDQHDIFGPRGIDQRRHIVHKMRQGVVCYLRRPGGAPVSALIDSPDAIAHSRQHRYLVPPGDGVLRKAVQAERQPYSGALLQHLEAQPVGLGAGIDLLINGDRNDGETRELFASDVMPHLA